LGAKNALQNGFWKRTWKINEKGIEQWLAFRRKSFQSVVRVANFKVFAISEKSKNPYQNVSKNDPQLVKKSSLVGAPMVDLFTFLWILCSVEKSLFFDVVLGR
jgi:hypothetical protein